MKKPKFKLGDKVKIVNYGAIVWTSKRLSKSVIPDSYKFLEENDTVFVYDTNPDLVGQEGIVEKVSGNQYALQGPYIHAWYNEEQLELINANPNTL